MFGILFIVASLEKDLRLFVNEHNDFQLQHNESDRFVKNMVRSLHAIQSANSEMDEVLHKVTNFPIRSPAIQRWKRYFMKQAALEE